MSNLRRTTLTSSTNRLISNNKNQNSAIKKKPLSKPAWDSTNSDLNQFKPSPDEIQRRKISCKSKNLDLVKYEKQTQEMLKSNKNNDETKQLGLLKEILYDDDQIKNLILKSDSTLKIVKDFFNNNDDAANNSNKKQAKINLTLAPNVNDLDESILPYNKPKNDPNMIQIKSKNLNEVSDNETHSEKEDEDSELKGTINIKDLEKCLKTLIKNKSEKTPPNQIKNVSNDTEKINRLKSSTQQEINNSEETSLFNLNNNKQNLNSLSELNDEFKKALNDLEKKLYDFEKHTGKQTPNADNLIKRSNLNQSKSTSYNSSFTLTLISIVSSLLDYLRDAVIELNYEKLKQVETNKQLDIHRKLIDGLTTEVLTVKDQNEKIINDFFAQNAKLSSDMDQIKIFLKASSLNFSNQLINTSQDSKTGRVSAFTSQPQINMENLIKPIAQHQQQQVISNSNDLRAFNLPLEDQNAKNDKFSERLNAMLQLDIQSNNLLKSTSVSHFQNLFQNQKFPSQNANNRPLSATFNSQTNLIELQNENFLNNNKVLNQMGLIRSNSGLSNINANCNTNSVQNKQSNFEYNSQIDDLKLKNLQAQQRLKQLQEEHKLNIIENKQYNLMQSSEPSINSNNSELNSDIEKSKNEALEKLKKEQQLLKEQINLLNKQRETAKQELEILNTSSGKKDKNIIQNSLIRHFNEINSNFDCEASTPGLSPIPPENLITETRNFILEQKSCLEVTPTRVNDYRMK